MNSTIIFYTFFPARVITSDLFTRFFGLLPRSKDEKTDGSTVGPEKKDSEAKGWDP
jgi:hypothetical protein